LLLGIAKNRGAVAFVTDGLVRDLSDIEALGLPCYAAGATPNSPSRTGPGSVGLPVQCGGLQVATGDIVVGDRDGVVVVPYDQIGSTISRLVDVRAAEATLLARVRAGLSEVDFISSELRELAGSVNAK
jgi:4-hydroxy-4-methyl-2-oxoglutarate aldolase